MSSANNHIDYIEFPAKSVKELNAVKDFFTEVFGWSYQQWGDDYADTNDSGVGSGINAEDPATAPLPVIYVTDIQAIYDKVKIAGASITKEIFDFPGGKRFHFQDPAGNELAVWSEQVDVDKITEIQDTRNVIDKFKGRSEAEIMKELDAKDHGLIIALENTERDFNMGTIVRSANAFGVRQIYVIGRRQWNKRGAMMTDKYLHVHYVGSTAEFVELMRAEDREIIAIDNIQGSVNMSETTLPERAVLVFGQEGPGISEEMAQAADKMVAIEQFGSTRSINVGAAATVAMYCWLQQHVLN